MRALSVTILGGTLLSACTGFISGDDGAPPGVVTPPAGTGSAASSATAAPSDVESSAVPATPTLTRLSVLQWANSVRDLLQLPSPGDLDNALTKDAVVRFDNEADSLFVGQGLHDDLQSEAERLAALVVADPAVVARLVPASAPADVAGKAKAYIESFGRLAYRRPLSPAEVQEYVTLFDQGPTLSVGLGTFEAGVRVTLEAFLQSPAFLYRTAFGGTAVAGRARLTDHEIAANLAYALTNHPPDADLASAADSKALSQTTAIVEQAQRLLPTEAGKAAVDRFFFQYFGLGQYDTLQKDPTLAPQFTDATGPLLHVEAQRLLQYLFSENQGLREIFTTPVGFVNAPLAKLYGLPGDFGADTWTQVNFDPAQRPGVLTRLGFVSYFAYQDQPNTIKRGASVNNRLLCGVLSPPADLVIPTLPEPDPNQTNREIVETFTNACGAGCHTALINPAGFAFENFDGLGAFRMTENGKPIDASGEYAFQEGVKAFSNVAEFNQAIADSSQAHACYTTKWAANLYSRLPRKGDEELAVKLARRSLAERLSSRDLVVALVSDDAFVTRVEGQQ